MRLKWNLILSSPASSFSIRAPSGTVFRGCPLERTRPITFRATRRMADLPTVYNGECTKPPVRECAVVPEVQNQNTTPPNKEENLHLPHLTPLKRPRPHRRHRRHRPPSPPRLHASRRPKRHHALGNALVANLHPAPPLSDVRQAHPHRLPLPPRPAPRTRAARGPRTRKHRRPALPRRTHRHRLFRRRQSAGAHQAARLCRPGPGHRSYKGRAAVYLF